MSILARVPLIGWYFPEVDPFPGDVKDFWRYMQDHYRTKVVSKNSVAEMKTVAEFLDLVGIVDRDVFLKRFTTTIGDLIYVPFYIGEAKEGWDLWQQIVTCVHEHQHVFQYREYGALKYSWDYVTNTASRAAYEVEAYRTGMEINWRYKRRMPNPVATAALLKSYGCNDEDVRFAEKSLSLAIRPIKAGGLTTDSSRTAAAWLDKHFRVVGG